MNNLGRKIKKSMLIITVVLFLVPSMLPAAIFDAGSVGGRDLFQVDDGTTQWVKIEDTWDLTYDTSSTWCTSNNFHVATRNEVLGLFHELLYNDGHYHYADEFEKITGIFENNELQGLYYFSAGVYDLGTTPGYARVEHNEDGSSKIIQDYYDLEMFSYGTGVWLMSNYGEQPPPPIPEPATILLFGIGLLGLAGASRRNNNRTNMLSAV